MALNEQQLANFWKHASDIHTQAKGVQFTESKLSTIIFLFALYCINFYTNLKNKNFAVSWNLTDSTSPLSQKWKSASSNYSYGVHL